MATYEYAVKLNHLAHNVMKTITSGGRENLLGSRVARSYFEGHIPNDNLPKWRSNDNCNRGNTTWNVFQRHDSDTTWEQRNARSRLLVHCQIGWTVD